MPIELRSNSALFRRAEQLKRWEDSETNKVQPVVPSDKKCRIKFSDGCVFLAACAASDTEEVDRLIKQGTDINTANVDGLTALHQACIDNNLDMVQFLVEHGADVNIGDNEGWTPLHATASCGSLSIASFLIEHGADPGAVNYDGDLPLDIAESDEMIALLSTSLDDQAIDCEERRSEEQRVMLEDARRIAASEVDSNQKINARTGATPLHVAASKGYMDVMRVLVEANTDLNAQDSDGWTPLHAAAHWGQREACELLADNLANMDIRNFAGRTCFDIADPELENFLRELKERQESMQKERPEIQAILERTSGKAPLKRRTSVTRMSGQEKSKSVMKDTKAERAQIENLSLPEEESETSKVQKKTAPAVEAVAKKDEPVKVPSWKKVLRRSAEEASANLDSEVVLKRPKKLTEEDKEKDKQAEAEGRNPDPSKPEQPPPPSPGSEGSEMDFDPSIASTSTGRRRPIIPPVRDDESELQRKAHAKRVRETRRSTQGVLLEDIKSAELQYLISTQKEAALRQAEEAKSESSEMDNHKNEFPLSQTTEMGNNYLTNSSKQGSVEESRELNDSRSPENADRTLEPSNKLDNGSRISDLNHNESAPSVTLALRPKSTSSPEDTSPTERTSLGTQAAIQRRRRPKRRSTGVVYLDSDDGPEDMEDVNEKDNSTSHTESGSAERPRPRYGSSTSIPDAASEASSRSDTSSRYSSKASLSEDDGKDYKKLYEDVKKENERLTETLKKTEEELEKARKQLQKLSQSTTVKNSVSEAEKKERRSLERKLSEMEEEIKNISKLKTEHEKLKAENRALSRVVCKLSKNMKN